MDEPKRILHYLTTGNFITTLHAKKRMAERNVSEFDIMECGSTGKATLQIDGKYKVDGFDQDGDELSIICVYQGNVLIITLF